MAFRESVARLGLDTPYDAQIAAAMNWDMSRITLVKGIIATESEWNPNAINPSDPSAGLMQMLPSTASLYRPGTTLDDLLDPVLSIDLGTRHVNDLLRRYSESDAVAAYNAGVPRKNAVNQYVNSKGDPMVQAYVDSVLLYQAWYMNHLPSPTPMTQTEPVPPGGRPIGGSAAPADMTTGWLIADLGLTLLQSSIFGYALWKVLS